MLAKRIPLAPKFSEASRKLKWFVNLKINTTFVNRVMKTRTQTISNSEKIYPRKPTSESHQGKMVINLKIDKQNHQLITNGWKRINVINS